jgi:predicted NUDIX family NTP pyrophosphohydrolase
MPKRSAGILMYRRRGASFEVLLVHPGGPFWARKEAGAWSIPKGEIGEGEDPFAVACREFREETGAVPQGAFRPLGDVMQSRKIVTAWAVEGEFDVAALKSNSFEIEWPPGSGRRQAFPEVDRARWFAPADAKRAIVRGQAPLIDRLAAQLAG